MRDKLNVSGLEMWQLPAKPVDDLVGARAVAHFLVPGFHSSALYNAAGVQAPEEIEGHAAALSNAEASLSSIADLAASAVSNVPK